MSVLLRTFKDPNAPSVELWAPDYDKGRLWICDDEDDDRRVDLTIEQARMLRDYLTEFLTRYGHGSNR